jgi:hypothetical protein
MSREIGSVGLNKDRDRPELQAGSRVKVVKDARWNGPWPSEPVGVVEPVLPGQLFIVSPSRFGSVKQYKVRFDEPQYDGDQQGPYVSAVIAQQYLVALDG